MTAQSLQNRHRVLHRAYARPGHLSGNVRSSTLAMADTRSSSRAANRHILCRYDF
jgi:hypothetical protein